MCGIAGKLYFNSQSQIHSEEIGLMLDQIKHRGPDDHGIETFGNVGLGQRRLSIIDLSPAGHNPMSTMDEKIWITFNGEIFNHEVHREALIKKGYKFKSKTDTEVILYLYKEYGEECLQYLRGFFAFAIWDIPKQKLFIARDRIGKKPLKYYLSDKSISFASELKAILADPSVPREVDDEALHHYLTLQYVQAPATGFRGIKKLPPAHYMVIQNGKVDIKRYWKLDYSKQLDLPEEEWIKRIRFKLSESTRIRLMSDVPLGAFLSGGVDSSAVVAMMAQHSSERVKTFSIGFNEKSHDETEYARMVAEKFNTEHTELIVDPKSSVDLFPKLAWHYEEPYADSSAIPTYYVSELTRKYVTVALNGDGGDENFAGYSRYDYHLLGKRYERIPSWIRQGVVANGTNIAKRIFKTTFFDRANRFAQSMAESPERRYYNYICYFTTEQKKALYTKEFWARMKDNATQDLFEELAKESGTNDYLDKVLYIDVNSYLPNDLMAKVDIASMAHSLEGRSPLLDHEFMEMTAQIPSSLKIKNGEKKYILKKAMEGILPNEILYRPKMGFGVPLVHWFRGDLKDYMYDVIMNGEGIKRGYFEKASVQQLLDEHTKTNIDQSNKIWALIMLEHWFDTWFK